MKDRASSLRGRLRQSDNSFSDAGRHCSQLSAGSCLSHQDFSTEAVTNVQNLVKFGTSQDVIVHDNLDSSLYPIMPDCTAHLSESLPRVDWYGSVWLRRPMMRTEWTITALLGIWWNFCQKSQAHEQKHCPWCQLAVQAKVELTIWADASIC